MDIGMLWFDNDRARNLTVKINRAASYYRKKYGQVPNLCFVHPSMLPLNGNGNGSKPKKIMAGKVEVRSATSILPNHFWIGIQGRSQHH